MTTISGLQQLRWDDEEDDIPVSHSADVTITDAQQDQSSFYLNMTSNKTEDSETIPLVNSQQPVQDVFPLLKADTVQDEYLSPIICA